ncbi:MAG: FapA family protein [Agarilytica sp.]
MSNKTAETANDASFAKLELSLVNDKVIAKIVSSDEACDFSMENLKSQLASAGFERLELNENTCLSLVRKVKNCELGDTELGALPPQIGIRFTYKEDSRDLIAIIEQNDIGEPPSFQSIKSDLEAQGFEKFPVKNTDISNLLLKVKNASVGEYPIAKKPEYTKLNIVFDEETNTLFADLSSCEEEVLVNRDTIQVALKEKGYDDYYFTPNALEKLFSQINKNDHGRYKIGERRDAAISVSFDDELMHGYITVSPPQGGHDLNQQLLKKALDDAGVYSSCCDQNTLDHILKSKQAEKLLFASGTEPKDGVDATFEPLVDEVVYSKPKETKTGKIDLREVLSFSQIESDIQLMKRIPAIPGENGRNVKGQVIPAREAIDTPFDEELIGAKICATDPNILVSTTKGHPVILPHSIKVDKAIVVESVDMSTGNINFDGSVLVRGEVKAGMQIKVTGDIIVKGVVTKASLYAKNDITIECGVVGTDPKKDGDESPPALLKAGGNVKAQYITLTEVHAGNDVDVKEYISHSQVEAKHKVLVGQGGGKGKVFGGNCYGRAGVEANSVGANGDIKTWVIAGIPKDQHKQFDQLLQAHKNREIQSEQLDLLHKKYSKLLQENPTDMDKINKINSIEKVRKQLAQEKEKMLHTINSVNQHLREAKHANVSVAKETFSNVSIAINGAEFPIRQEAKGGIFVKQGDEIRWMNYTKK